MTKQTIIVFVNGILVIPGQVVGWTERACEWVNSKTEFKADRYEYFADALFHAIKEPKRVEDLFSVMDKYITMQPVLVGHSNGCDIICKLLKNNDVAVKSIHLIAGACERDFDKNGLNDAVKLGKVDSINIYGSNFDKALIKAKSTGWFMRLFGAAYGTLGLEGPVNMSQGSAAITKTIWKDGYDHSTWFWPENFDTTMRGITQ